MGYEISLFKFKKKIQLAHQKIRKELILEKARASVNICILRIRLFSSFFFRKMSKIDLYIVAFQFVSMPFSSLVLRMDCGL